MVTDTSGITTHRIEPPDLVFFAALETEGTKRDGNLYKITQVIDTPAGIPNSIPLPVTIGALDKLVLHTQRIAQKIKGAALIIKGI